MNILLVASDPQYKLLLRQLITSEGHDVTLAKTGREGLQILKANRIELVVTEFELPFMDGYTLLQMARASSRGETIPFIIIYRSEEERKRMPPGEVDRCTIVSKNTAGNQLSEILHHIGSTESSPLPKPSGEQVVAVPHRAPPVAAPTQRHTKARILLVDDEESFRMMLRDTMEDEGYENITMAADGGEAIELLKKQQYDLVILDIVMPLVSGFGVLHFIHDNVAATKVIMLTAYAEMRLAVEAKELGAADFIAKPIMRSDFFRTIEHVMSS
jgi:two-component system sensor histidine kinase/response regulator